MRCDSGWYAAAMMACSMMVQGIAGGVQPRAHILRCDLPSESPELIDALSAEIGAAGYAVEVIGLDGLTSAGTGGAGRHALLVIPDAGHLPTVVAPAIDRHARDGGSLIALQTPIWRKPMIRTDDGWTDRVTCQRKRAALMPEHIFLHFEPGSTRDWQSFRYPPESSTSLDTVDDGPAPGARALHVVSPKLVGYAVHSPKDLVDPFPPGHTLTIFSAKGVPGTDQMSVEWEEQDGSRWVAIVDLEPRWRQYLLFPEDFRYWHSVPARAAGCFRPENAQAIRFGVSQSHTPGLTNKPYEFWVGPVGTAAPQPIYEQLRSPASLPTFDTLAPAYKLFNCHNVASLRTSDDAAFIAAGRLDVPEVVRSPHPRARGGGFDKRRAWRWLPLLEARTGNGEWRGTPATLTLHADGAFKGGAWASFGLQGPEWYVRPEARRMLREAAVRLRVGAYILDGGADRFTYFDDQSIRLGLQAFAIQNASPPDKLTARVTVIDRDSGKSAFEQTWPIRIEPRTVAKVETTWKPATWPAAGFACSAELLAGDRIIDRVRHEIHVWRPREPKRYVTIEEGRFRLDGRPWRAHGVNYMPTSGTSSDDYAYFNQYLSAPSYDPGVIARDLAHVRDMGFNAISIFLVHANRSDGNLLDLLRQAEALDLKVNLALVPTTPMNFQAQNIREMIEACRLPEHDGVFAIDVDWEPIWGPQEHRARWDQEWAAWIAERYGNVEAAERDWNCKVPRTGTGAITNPPAEQIDADGPHRVMVAAYRRFLDTLLYRKYGAATRFIRTLDPLHFISFRMSSAGDPTNPLNGWLPYDFPYLGAAVDFLEPEAYGRIGDWERVKPGWFEVCYARWATPDKPVLWAEAGMSAWEASRMAASPEALQAQADFYEHFYKMLIASSSDGVFFWYYPGGYRSEERSDFGIINPDGSDRPVTRIIRKYSPLFLACPAPKPVDTWIEFDRDADATGVVGVYKAVRQQFWKAIDEGGSPGLRTAGTGTTSTDCPALAVGNTPMNGTNPPKFLDAAFDRVEIRNVEGKFIQVDKGGQLHVRADRPVLARATIRNLGEAAWVAGQPNQTGGVSLIASGPRTRTFAIDRRVDRHEAVSFDECLIAPPGMEQPAIVTLFLNAENRSPFGERFWVRLIPQAP